MSGYAPLFQSVFTGTLHGKWPDIGLWACLLGLSDKHGVIDCTPSYIASVTGMTVAEITACLERFMSPDPYSRSTEEEGRRLVLIDPDRPWGWRIVNHAKYREKARKQFHNSAAIESGENKARMQTRRDQTRPATTDSHTQTHTQTQKQEEVFSPPPGLNREAFERFSDYRSSIGKPLPPASVFAAQRKLAGFGAKQAEAVERTIANGWFGLFHEEHKGAKPERQRYVPTAEDFKP